jgi:NADH-quinone oxidoreductase subunit C
MSAKLERLSQTLRDVFGERIQSLVVDRGEVTIEVALPTTCAWRASLR